MAGEFSDGKNLTLAGGVIPDSVAGFLFLYFFLMNLEFTATNFSWARDLR